MFVLKRLYFLMIISLICIQGCFDDKTTNDILTQIEDIKSIHHNMVLIPAGEFTMGDNELGLTEHVVYIDAFYIDIYEVTVGDYLKFCDATGTPYPPSIYIGWHEQIGVKPGEGKKYYNNPYPVHLVNHEQASSYAKWIDKRLPTEAEWEKSARGGLESQKYSWGSASPIRDNSNLTRGNFLYAIPPFTPMANTLMPVGQYEPNGYGLYDVSGNVTELCQDYYHPNAYDIHEYNNPVILIPGPQFETGKDPKDLRVTRGPHLYSLYRSRGNKVDRIRIALRSYQNQPRALNTTSTGFRCAKDIK